MATKTSTQVKSFSFNDIERLYVGAQGCACGCGGEYISNTPKNQEIISKYLKRINNRFRSNPDGLDVEGNYASIEYTTKAIRIYFKDEVSYSNWNGLTRYEDAK